MDVVNLRSVVGVCCAIVALAVVAAPAEAKQPSPDKMMQMGLSGAEIVPDVVAQQVRGKLVVVWGRSRAGTDSDHYVRVRKNFAAGGSFAASGGTFAGGFSFASAR